MRDRKWPETPDPHTCGSFLSQACSAVSRSPARTCSNRRMKSCRGDAFKKSPKNVEQLLDFTTELHSKSELYFMRNLWDLGLKYFWISSLYCTVRPFFLCKPGLLKTICMNKYAKNSQVQYKRIMGSVHHGAESRSQLTQSNQVNRTGTPPDPRLLHGTEQSKLPCCDCCCLAAVLEEYSSPITNDIAR